ncbi:MAG: anaerobic ribonucleoside-triphosphate reductase activating protein [Candidatus Paceibacterota bacterium]
MFFGGIQKVSLIDYPSKVATTLFTIGCNFLCPYCQNPELVLKDLIKKHLRISEKEVLEFLKERRGLIEGICITGGEPLIHFLDLKNFLKKVRKIKYSIKLDSNGSFPERLEELIKEGLVDYVALDVKAPKEKYFLVSSIKDVWKKIEKSIKILKESKLDYEFRTTLAPFLQKEDILKIVEWIKPAKAYYLQRFQSKKVLDKNLLNTEGIKEEEIKEIIEKIKPFFEICQIR